MFIYSKNCIKAICGTVLLAAANACAMAPTPGQERAALILASHARLGSQSPLEMLDVNVFAQILSLVPVNKRFNVISDDETRLLVSLTELPNNYQPVGNFAQQFMLGRSPIHPVRGHAAAAPAIPYRVNITAPIANILISVSDSNGHFYGAHAFNPQEIENIAQAHVTKSGIRVIDEDGNTQIFGL